jgi:hypothetical protein
MALNRILMSPQQVGRPFFWERPSHALPDRVSDASRPRLRGAVNELVKYAYIDARLRRAKNPNMTLVRITGGMLRAARSLAGLSQREVADRAAILRPSLTTWEGSSGSQSRSGRGPTRSRLCTGFTARWRVYSVQMDGVSH